MVRLVSLFLSYLPQPQWYVVDTVVDTDGPYVDDDEESQVGDLVEGVHGG